MSANLENSAVARGLKRVVFIPAPKKGNAKECSNYHTFVFISHASKEKKVKVAHRLNRHGFGWTSGVGDGQGGLACCGSWGRKLVGHT